MRATTQDMVVGMANEEMYSFELDYHHYFT